MFGRIATFALAATAALALSGCFENAASPDARTDGGAYCERYPAICIAAGVAVVGGIIALGLSQHTDSAIGPHVIGSDLRLKEDVRPVGTLPNGLPLYAFRYKGDDQYFISVMAQDVLARPDLRGSVDRGADGFYRVDAHALGLAVFNGEAMRAAGDRAARLAAAEPSRRL